MVKIIKKITFLFVLLFYWLNIHFEFQIPSRYTMKYYKTTRGRRPYCVCFAHTPKCYDDPTPDVIRRSTIKILTSHKRLKPLVFRDTYIFILYPQPATTVVLGQKTWCDLHDCCKTRETFWRTTGLCGVGDGQISACLVTARTVAGSGDIRHHVSVGKAVYCSSSCPELISGGGLTVVCRFTGLTSPL